MGLEAYFWRKSYPPDVSHEIEIPERYLDEILRQSAARWPDLTCAEFYIARWTYAEMDALVDRAARGFQDLGVGPGVHVGLFLPNMPHYIVCFLGVLRAGGTVVNFSPLYAEREIRHQIDDSDVSVMVTLDLEVLYPRLATAAAGSRVEKLVVGTLGDVLPAPAVAIAGQPTAEIPDDGRHVLYAALLDNAGDPAPPERKSPDTTVAVLQYTGGTTGVPKGAMLSHRNIVASISMSSAWSAGTLIEGDERVILVLPLFHIYALSTVLLAGLMRGATLLIHPRFDPKQVLGDIRSKDVTLFPGVPTMYMALLAEPDFDQTDLSGLKAFFSGGAPLPVEVMSQLEARGKCPVLEGYGLTETSPACISNPWTGVRKKGSIGVPLPSTNVEIRDVEDSSKLMGIGEPGEICVIGPQVTQGYWQKPEETALALRDGRLHTGDIGYIDEDGFVFLVDRKKDMIISSGYNVYPRNIEEAVYEHPAVAEVTVIGVPDDYRGQAAKAFIKLNDGASLEFEELIDFLGDKLGRHELPTEMELRDELPKTPVGKLSKKELIAEELAIRSRDREQAD
jgi:long-chain acyl-CoA synthetase